MRIRKGEGSAHCAARTRLKYPLARIYGESVQIAIQPLPAVALAASLSPSHPAVVVILVVVQTASATKPRKPEKKRRIQQRPASARSEA